MLANTTFQAVKFTVNRSVRRIQVHYGASEGDPPVIQTPFGRLEWSQSQSDLKTASILPPRESGGKPLHLWFYVEDSGPGMTPEEMKKLFKRFSQANSRTHIEYGGSGIGLYICQQLAEKQDGGVGVASKLGEGSVFGFYVETRRAREPSAASPRQNLIPQLPRRSTDRSGLPSLALSPEISSTMETPTISEKKQIPQRPKMIRPYTEPNPIRFKLLLVEDVSRYFHLREFVDWHS